MTVVNRSMVFLFVLALNSVLLAGCSSDDAQTTSASATTGRVSLLLTDKPTDDFDQINITVNSWQLLGDGAPVLLSDTVETINLLDLRNSFDVVVGAIDVPIGSYSKIRLDVAQIELVKLDVDGNIIPPIELPKLPSGKIDLVFSGNIVVAANSTLVLKIDMDADNSIQYHATGNDKYIFRPVVRIDVVSDSADAVIRLGGVVFDKQVAPATEMFVLCRADAVVVTDDCTRVNVNNSTTFLDGDMLPGDYSALGNGDRVLLFGLLDPGTGRVDAIRVLHQSYDADNLPRLISLMSEFGGPVVADRAPLVTSGNSIHVPAGTSLDTDLANTLIVNQQGVILGDTAVDAGVGAEVFGILLPDNTAPVAIRAGFVILNEPVLP